MELVGEKRKMYRILVGNLMEGDSLEDLVVDGRSVLKGILKALDKRAWTVLILLRIKDCLWWKGNEQNCWNFLIIWQL